MLKINKIDRNSDYESLLKRSAINFQETNEKVEQIISKVKDEGDKALIEFAEKFDGVKLSQLEVPFGEISLSINKVGEELKDAINVAVKNITKFHRAQIQNTLIVETMSGVECTRKSVPIEKVGLYIPGGTAPLFSSLLMLAIPAIEAGCEEIIVCSPPQKDGEVHPLVLYVAQLLGLKKIYKVGGAQAIAAMAFGTETIPKVHKIFGPGNQFVTAAKQLVTNFGVAIDLPAGPSEVMVVADETSNPDFVAADLLSQAEHGVDSQVVLITNNQETAEKVNLSIQKFTANLSRKNIIEKALENSVTLVVEDKLLLIDIVNFYAAEHLILSIDDAEDFSEYIINAGSVFIGHYTPESAGDYASGTNHTLPTYGYAKAYSGVSLDSFVKKITFQRISKKGLKNLGPSIITMANAENLDAHALAVKIRIND